MVLCRGAKSMLHRACARFFLRLAAKPISDRHGASATQRYGRNWPTEHAAF
jgi:hypothetical protein